MPSPASHNPILLVGQAPFDESASRRYAAQLRRLQLLQTLRVAEFEVDVLGGRIPGTSAPTVIRCQPKHCLLLIKYEHAMEDLARSSQGKNRHSCDKQPWRLQRSALHSTLFLATEARAEPVSAEPSCSGTDRQEKAAGLLNLGDQSRLWADKAEGILGRLLPRSQQGSATGMLQGAICQDCEGLTAEFELVRFLLHGFLPGLL